MDADENLWMRVKNSNSKADGQLESVLWNSKLGNLSQGAKIAKIKALLEKLGE
jgi:hypothetical protein